LDLESFDPNSHQQGDHSMENPIKTNRLAVISIVCGLIVLLSLGFYDALFQIVHGNPSETSNTALLGIMDQTVPIRNIFSTVALIMGIVALVEIKKKEGAEKGKLLAWVGIVLGAAWFITRLAVGLTFLLSEILN
jgi:hypothetical protein